MIEAGGARAALLPCTGDWSAFKAMVSSVNGFLFTGMYTEYAFPNNTATPYGQRGNYIIDYVISSATAGNPLPLFAICKGYMMTCVWLHVVRQSLARRGNTTVSSPPPLCRAFHISGVVAVADLISPVNALNWTAPIVPNPSNLGVNATLYRCFHGAVVVYGVSFQLCGSLISVLKTSVFGLQRS